MCYCRRCRERRRARAKIKDHEQTAKVEFARDAARASSGIAKSSGRSESAALTATRLIDTLQGPPTPAPGFSLAATDSGWSRAFRFLKRELEPISEHRGSRTAIGGFRTGCASRVRVRTRGRNPAKVLFRRPRFEPRKNVLDCLRTLHQGWSIGVILRNNFFIASTLRQGT